MINSRCLIEAGEHLSDIYAESSVGNEPYLIQAIVEGALDVRWEKETSAQKQAFTYLRSIMWKKN